MSVPAPSSRSSRGAGNGASVNLVLAGWHRCAPRPWRTHPSAPCLPPRAAPNIANFKVGREVQAILHPPFFAELQSRYGNMFFVRRGGGGCNVDATECRLCRAPSSSGCLWAAAVLTRADADAGAGAGPPPSPAMCLQVREQGESAAVLSIVDALTGCLAKGGCAVVPGLSPDHYFFTLGVSMAGGLVAGAACKLEPTGGWW